MSNIIFCHSHFSFRISFKVKKKQSNMDQSKVGYKGNTIYTLRYALWTRNFRNTWPFNNILSKVREDEESLILLDIMKQNVGVECDITKIEIESLQKQVAVFLNRHQKTNYKLMLRKVVRQISSNKSSCVKFKKSICKTHKILQRKQKEFFMSKKPLNREIIKELLHRIIFRVIPIKLFGNTDNRLKFQKAVKRILFMGKAQVFPLKILMTGMTTKGVEYLLRVNGNFSKTNMQSKLFIWLIKVYLFALLKTLFYITEGNYSNKLSFFTKQTWQSLHNYSFNNIKDKIEILSKNQKIKTQEIPILRFLPKNNNGTRAVYFRMKKVKRNKNILSDMELAVKFLSSISGRNCATVIKSTDNFHVNWLHFFCKWRLSKKPVYFVRIDFFDAFGSIKQNKLLEIIRNLYYDSLKGDVTYVEVNFGKTKYKIPTNVALLTVEKYIKHCVFKNNKYIYKLIRGIAQGGTLSNLLCDIYLADVDWTYLKDYFTCSDTDTTNSDHIGFLCRYCDDYLYITTDYSKASQFLNIMENGFTDHGMYINVDKTETNVRDNSINILNFASSQIDVKSMQIFSSFQSYENRSIFHTFQIRKISNVGTLLSRKLSMMKTIKLNRIYLDDLYNNKDTIIRNIFFSACLTAVKFNSLVNTLFQHYNQLYLYRCMIRSAKSTSRIIGLKAQCKLVNDVAIQWICLQAFTEAFTAKDTSFNHKFVHLINSLNRVKFNLYCQMNEEEKSFIQNGHFSKLPNIFNNNC